MASAKVSKENESDTKDSKCHLLALPAELRLEIYDHHLRDIMFASSMKLACSSFEKPATPLLGACKSTREEVRETYIKHLQALIVSITKTIGTLVQEQEPILERASAAFATGDLADAEEQFKQHSILLRKPKLYVAQQARLIKASHEEQSRIQAERYL